MCKEKAFPISFQGTDMIKNQTKKSHYCNHGAGVMAESSKNTWLNACQRSKLLARQLYSSKTPSSGLSPNGSPWSVQKGLGTGIGHAYRKRGGN